MPTRIRFIVPLDSNGIHEVWLWPIGFNRTEVKCLTQTGREKIAE
jgi:hypothetical protein